MAANTPHGALEVALSSGGFSQTGSWSMVDLAKLPVQHAVAMLSRYAAARVNPYTVLVGEAMGLTFRMGRRGRANLEDALSTLSAVGLLGNTLHIGFGIEDVIRTMARSEGGAMQMGLCAALQECYSDDIAVEILLEYARVTRANGQWMPSNMEWRSLLDTCSGCLASSTFPRTAEHFMQLAKGDLRLRMCYRDSLSRHRGCSKPSSIAAGLVALSRISLGQMQSVVLVGGPDVGFLVAIAEWFLNLRVRIFTENDDDVLFTNHENIEETQVTAVYQRRSLRTQPSRSSAPSVEAGSVNPADIVTVRGRTFRINLETMERSIMTSDADSRNKAVVSGRLSWKSALRSTFASEFDVLMRTPDTLGTMIGSAASLLRGFAEANETIPDVHLRAFSTYAESSFGRGFVASAIVWFPELGVLREAMNRTMKANFADAKMQYERCLSLVEARCLCKICALGNHGFGPEQSESDEDDTADEASTPGDEPALDQEVIDQIDRERFCLVVIVEAIINLCRTLSGVTVMEGLNPTRRGLELAYTHAEETRFCFRSRTASSRRLGQILFCVDLDEDMMRRHPGRGWSTNDICRPQLSSILELFSGRRATALHGGASALWLNGVCVFQHALTDQHSESRNDIRRFHVIPGRIAFEGKSYTRIEDMTTRERLARLAFENRHLQDILATSQHALEVGKMFRTKTMSVREGSDALECLIEFPPSVEHTHSLNGISRISVGPSSLTSFLTARYGLVHCLYRGKQKCPKSRAVQSLARKQVGDSYEFESHGRIIRFLVPKSSTHALTLLAYLAGQMITTFIVDQECESCCLGRALTIDSRHTTLVCFVRTS